MDHIRITDQSVHLSEWRQDRQTTAPLTKLFYYSNQFRLDSLQTDLLSR